jgi:hypothetical protein
MGKAAVMVIGVIALAWMMVSLLAVALCRMSARSETPAPVSSGNRRRQPNRALPRLEL